MRYAPAATDAKYLPTPQLTAILRDFVRWLDRYGETSRDHQTFFASPRTRAFKALYYRKPLVGTLAVAPLIACEAFAPSTRRFFWKPQRFPIADAHYAMGFAYLARAWQSDEFHERAIHFLQVLESTRSSGFEHLAWGYPFDWETRLGTIRADTPLITTLPYVYEAFRGVYQIDRDIKWLERMRSIAEHAYHDYRDHATSPTAASCAYSPDPNDPAGVINASAYRAFLLTAAAFDLGEPRYAAVAERNRNFVLESQNEDGSWYYATDGTRDFVDHFHTCFVMKALAKIDLLTGREDCATALDRGVAYYCRHLFDAEGMPRPFSRRPRLTVYKRELYDYAECINLCLLLRARHPALQTILSKVSALEGWIKPDGSFRSRQLLFGWDDVPMHRWAQSQMFRSLALLLLQESQTCGGRFLGLEPLGRS